MEIYMYYTTMDLGKFQEFTKIPTKSKYLIQNSLPKPLMKMEKFQNKNGIKNATFDEDNDVTYVEIYESKRKSKYFVTKFQTKI